VDPLVVLFGLAVGVLVGLTGIGGGSLMTPLLVLGAGVPPAVAIGTDLAYGAVTKSLGGWRVWRAGRVDLGLSGWLAAGSVPGALLGVLLLERLPGLDGPALLVAIAVALAVVAVALLARCLLLPHAELRERAAVPLARDTKALAAGLGLAIGTVLGLTSVGSGALVGLALILVFRLTPHRVVGTDVFHAAILLWVAGAAHWLGGNVDLALMATILAGSLPGVWVGTALLGRVPARGLRPALGCVLLGSALALLSEAGAHVPPAAVVGLPVAAGATVLLAQRRIRRTEVAPA